MKQGTEMADKFDLEKMTLPELKDLRKKLDKTIAGYEERRRREAVAAAEAAAREMGFSLSELTGNVKKSRKPAASPKFRNPDDPQQTWSGRGRQPMWFKEALASSKREEDLLIG